MISFKNTKHTIKCYRNKYDSKLGRNTNSKFINRSPTGKISHSFTLTVLERNYSKILQTNYSKSLNRKILGLSTGESYLYLKISFYLHVPFIRFWPPALINGTSPLWYINYFLLPSNLNISLFSTTIQIVLLSGGTYQQMSSLNSSVSTETDSQN